MKYIPCVIYINRSLSKHGACSHMHAVVTRDCPETEPVSTARWPMVSGPPSRQHPAAQAKQAALRGSVRAFSPGEHGSQSDTDQTTQQRRNSHDLNSQSKIESQDDGNLEWKGGFAFVSCKPGCFDAIRFRNLFDSMSARNKLPDLNE